MIFQRAGLLFLIIFTSFVPVSAEDLVVTFIDCGQGEATLIQTPNGKNILVDAGVIEERENFDAGRDILIPYLTNQGIQKLDAAVFTHPHVDHIGGFLSLFKKIGVKSVYDPGYSYPTPEYKKLLELVQKKNAHFTVVRAGDKIDWDPALKVSVLGPPKNLPWDLPNNNSIVLRIEHGVVSFLLTADIESDAEYELIIRQGPKLASTILKVPHHGAKTSSTEEFLDYVKPEVAVISCGRHNRFKHPNATVVRRYKDRNVQVYRTDKQGTIRINSDGENYKVWVMGVE
ncbi:MAG TPA: ComEC/Rec2 family competence protein [Elusimicrobiota bacterium]|nr:ComEC/Rec2 family competence protein [Elusimicrobiota bacterium]